MLLEPPGSRPPSHSQRLETQKEPRPPHPSHTREVGSLCLRHREDTRLSLTQNSAGPELPPLPEWTVIYLNATAEDRRALRWQRLVGITKATGIHAAQNCPSGPAPQHSLHSMAEWHAHQRGPRDLSTAWTWAKAKRSLSPPHLERSYCSIVEESVTMHSRGSSGQA